MRLPGLGVANKLQKAADKLKAGDQPGDEAAQAAADKFRGRAALSISVLAALLALASAGADGANQAIINSNIEASNLWSFYQAKNARQTMNGLAADDLEAEVRLRPDLDPALKADLEKVVEKRRATAARYESEPDPADPENPLKGDGKKQLMARARDWEDRATKSQQKAKNFGIAGILLQIGVVLGSVAILANNKWSFLGLFIAGAIGFVFLANAYLLLVRLPI
jgi:hypothetical protein